MSIDELSVEEIVSTLERASLPTILVEGRDDMTTYRWLEEKLGTYNANVLACGGKEKLLAVFSKRQSFSHLKTVFLADKDIWLFTSIPKQYSDIIFTSGFSIENDILDSSDVHTLLTPKEQTDFNLLARRLSRWFAFEIEEHCAGRDCHLSIHINRIIPDDTNELCFDAIFPRSFREPKQTLTMKIYRKFTLRFRGKSLLQLYARLLSDAGRRSKYSKTNILEISTKISCSVHLRRILKRIRNQLNIKQSSGDRILNC